MVVRTGHQPGAPANDIPSAGGTVVVGAAVEAQVAVLAQFGDAAAAFDLEAENGGFPQATLGALAEGVEQQIVAGEMGIGDQQSRIEDIDIGLLADVADGKVKVGAQIPDVSQAFKAQTNLLEEAMLGVAGVVADVAAVDAVVFGIVGTVTEDSIRTQVGIVVEQNPPFQEGEIATGVLAQRNEAFESPEGGVALVGGTVVSHAKARGEGSRGSGGSAIGFGLEGGRGGSSGGKGSGGGEGRNQVSGAVAGGGEGFCGDEAG